MINYDWLETVLRREIQLLAANLPDNIRNEVVDQVEAQFMDWA